MEKHFFWMCPGMGIAYDIRAPDLDAAKERIRAHLGVKRLPRNTAVWESNYNPARDPTQREFSSIKFGG